MKAYSEMNVAELKALGKKLEIKGSDQMKKADLISALEKIAPAAVDPIVKENQDQEKKADDISGQKSEDLSEIKNDDLQSHPKFAKFKKGAN